MNIADTAVILLIGVIAAAIIYRSAVKIKKGQFPGCGCGCSKCTNNCNKDK